MATPLFITFEGIEGCGKTTQIALLKKHLTQKGITVTLTREPGGTAIADSIRGILLNSQNKKITPLTELLLYTAARAQHVEELIHPALAQGHLVLCDRFTDATFAYQGHGRDLDKILITNLNSMATQGLVPNKTFLLDLDPAEGVKRALTRNAEAGGNDESRFENEKLEFHKRVRNGYLELSQKEPSRFEVIDASGTVDGIHQIIVAKMDAILTLK